jgi:hypothetical protein
LCQLNTMTNKARPLLVDLPPAVHGIEDGLDELVISPHAEQNDDVPSEYRFPITTSIMRVPVMAADGHTYEHKAILRWMLNKRTSPVTGVALPNCDLTINHTLRKLIADSCVEQEESEEETSEASGVKRKAVSTVTKPAVTSKSVGKKMKSVSASSKSVGSA